MSILVHRNVNHIFEKRCKTKMIENKKARMRQSRDTGTWDKTQHEDKQKRMRQSRDTGKWDKRHSTKTNKRE